MGNLIMSKLTYKKDWEITLMHWISKWSYTTKP